MPTTEIDNETISNLEFDQGFFSGGTGVENDPLILKKANVDQYLKVVAGAKETIKFIGNPLWLSNGEFKFRLAMTAQGKMKFDGVARLSKNNEKPVSTEIDFDLFQLASLLQEAVNNQNKDEKKELGMLEKLGLLIRSIRPNRQ